MTIINDLKDRTARLPVAYGRHVVKGTLTKHVVTTNQVTVQQALGAASLWDSVNQKFFCCGWDSIEHLYYQGFEILAANYNFHSGGPADAPDGYFADDIAHPKASYYSAKLPPGMSVANQPDQMIGIFKTLKTANYNTDGTQIDSDGNLIPGGADPDDYLFYSPSPARAIADLMRRARRSLINIDWPAWCHFRDYCATLINWDDGALTPHQVSLAASAGGTLAAATYWVRIATLKGGDISSASKDRASDGIATASVVCSGGNLQFTVTWASQADRGATGYRVYIGTAEGGEDRYFTVGSGATNTLLISTLTGATVGAPPEIATGSLLRQIPRFESHLFFVPPFDLIAAIDRIAQVSCMDWQYAGGLLKFLTPEVRDLVFTVNLAEVANFRTYQTDRRQKPNQIVVNYRDLDDQYLSQADPPVEINRPALQAKEGVRPFYIDMGCAYRSQAERVGNYWARRLIDSDQMVELEGSPKTYIVLPGDPINVTHDVPNWTNQQFYVESKEEPEDTKAGYPMVGRIYGAWYSDTDSKPLPRPLAPAVLNPFAAPPLITNLTLIENNVLLPEGTTLVTSIRGAVQFAAFVGQQRGRVWWFKPGAGDYVATDITLLPDPATLQAAFEITGVAPGLHKFKVVTESILGVSQAFASHAEYTITIAAPANSLMQLLDLPIWRDREISTPPGIYIGVAQAAAGSYFGTVIQRDDGNGYSQIARILNQATLGTASTALADGTVYGFDEVSTVRVQVKYGKTLISVTEAQSLNGANMAALGVGANKEIFQFKTATLVDGTTDTYDLSGLNRGLFGTEFATSLHAINDEFCLLRDHKGGESNVAFLPIPVQHLNQARNYRSYTINQAEADGTVQSFTWTGNSHRPYAPVNFTEIGSAPDDVHLFCDARTRIAGNLRDFRVPIVGEERTELRLRLKTSGGADLDPVREFTVIPGRQSMPMPLKTCPVPHVDTLPPFFTKTQESSVYLWPNDFAEAGLIYSYTGDGDSGAASIGLAPASGECGQTTLNSYVAVFQGGASPRLSIQENGTEVAHVDGMTQGSRVRIVALKDRVEFYINYGPSVQPAYVSPLVPYFPLKTVLTSEYGGFAGIGSDVIAPVMSTRSLGLVYAASQRLKDYGSTSAAAYGSLWQVSALVGRGRELSVSF